MYTSRKEVRDFGKILLFVLLFLVWNTAEAVCTYQVEKGDTLWAIAKDYETTVVNLHRTNTHISNPHRIYVGQVIVIPNCTEDGKVLDEARKLVAWDVPGENPTIGCDHRLAVQVLGFPVEVQDALLKKVEEENSDFHEIKRGEAFSNMLFGHCVMRSHVYANWKDGHGEPARIWSTTRGCYQYNLIRPDICGNWASQIIRRNDLLGCSSDTVTLAPLKVEEAGGVVPPTDEPATVEQPVKDVAVVSTDLPVMTIEEEPPYPVVYPPEIKVIELFVPESATRQGTPQLVEADVPVKVSVRTLPYIAPPVQVALNDASDPRENTENCRTCPEFAVIAVFHPLPQERVVKSGFGETNITSRTFTEPVKNKVVFSQEIPDTALIPVKGVKGLMSRKF